MSIHQDRTSWMHGRSIQSAQIGRYNVSGGAALPQSGRSLLAAGFSLLRTMGRRGKMRRDLLSLSDDQLRDVGITRDQALREAERLAWRGDWN